MAVNLISAAFRNTEGCKNNTRLACYGWRDQRVWVGENKPAKNELFQIHLLTVRQRCTTSGKSQKPLGDTWRVLACFDWVSYRVACQKQQFGEVNRDWSFPCKPQTSSGPPAFPCQVRGLPPCWVLLCFLASVLSGTWRTRYHSRKTDTSATLARSETSI